MNDYLSRFTFYDVVGYLLPGMVAVLGVSAIGSLIDLSWALPAPTGAAGWSAYLIAAYITGHAIQVVSSKLICRRRTRTRILPTMPEDWFNPAGMILASHNLPIPTDKKKIIDAIDVLKLDSEDREIFVARQGFYRGLAIVFALLAVPCLISAIFGRPIDAFGFIPSRAQAGVVAVVLAVLAVLFRQRYADFVRHELVFGVASSLRNNK